MSRLRAYLYQVDPVTRSTVAFPKGTPRSDLPDWVKVDDGAFEGNPPASAASVKIPPVESVGTHSEDSGSRPAGNASREVWVEYATSLGVEVGDRDSRTEIISAVDSL